MRALPWILVGVGIGAVITVLVANSEPEYATGYRWDIVLAGSAGTWTETGHD